MIALEKMLRFTVERTISVAMHGTKRELNCVTFDATDISHHDKNSHDEC